MHTLTLELLKNKYLYICMMFSWIFVAIIGYKSGEGSVNIYFLTIEKLKCGKTSLFCKAKENKDFSRINKGEEYFFHLSMVLDKCTCCFTDRSIALKSFSFLGMKYFKHFIKI